MDPLTMMLISGLMQGVGGAFQGQQAANQSKQGLAEQAREYDLNRSDKNSKYAQSSPMRDQLAYLLQSRLSSPSQAFTPHNMFNAASPAQTQMGGVDPQAMAAATKAYQPGMGGQMAWNPQHIGFGGYNGGDPSGNDPKSVSYNSGDLQSALKGGTMNQQQANQLYFDPLSHTWKMRS